MKSSQQVRRPLVGVALSLAAGLYLQRAFDLPPLLLLALSAIALSVAAGSERNRQAAAFSACLMLAAAYGAVEQIHTPPGSSLRVAETLSSRQEMVGTVAGDPEGDEENGALQFLFKLEAVHFAEGWRPADSVIRVRMKSPANRAAYGDRWRLQGRYRSYETTYSGTEGTLYTAGSDSVRVQRAPFSLKGLCYKLRRRAAPALQAGVQAFPEHTRLLQALLLGYRNGLPADFYQTFSRTGTLHIFAISGLHVGVMAAILIAGLKMVGVSKPHWGLFLIPLLFFYVLSTGMKPSAFRAFTMAAVYFAAPLVRRRPDSVSAISLSAIILLLMNPLQLGDPGFLLSFTVVSGIVMVHLYVARRLSGFNRPGWAVPLAQISGPRPVMAAGRAVAMLALTSVAAWLFSAPLTAAFFHTVSPAALLGNLAIIPLTFMIVLTGCLSLLAAPVLFSATVVFNHANRVFITLLLAVIKSLGDLPGACRFVCSPSVVTMALWYGGLVLIFVAPRRWGRAGALFFLLAGVMWFAAPLPDVKGVQIAKESDAAIWIRTESSEEQILVTNGDAYGIARASRRLQKEGINRIPTLAVRGAEMDADALYGLCKTFSVQRVWMLPAFRNDAAANRLAESGAQILFSAHPRWSAGDGVITVDLN
ncbi:MAG: ComEC/Rec2 family competence protein [Kiritimatiellales bacterium]|nr:ComEC/Rec2 family competence protein [Kiritimatiellota bacterium]MBL7011718.1 ComEC/Rec2 family competence protein [Kiritimatiellales bacterium]